MTNNEITVKIISSKEKLITDLEQKGFSSGRTLLQQRILQIAEVPEEGPRPPFYICLRQVEQ